jgi:hypothetical protein
MINITEEQPIRLQDATRILAGRGGRPVHFSTVLRWCLKGCRGLSGEVVRLEALRIGGAWCTSKEAIQRFAERLTGDFATESPHTPRSPGRRERDSARAAKALEKIGI